MELQRPLYVDGFDDALIRLVESNKCRLLEAGDELRRRVAESQAIGDLLTGDIIAKGQRVIRSVGVRNRAPLFPPIFLTFLDNLDWIGPTDAALVRMRRTLAGTPKVYRNFVTRTAAEPMGGLFELNVFEVLDRAFPVAEPQPKLIGSSRRADVRIVLDGAPVFVEAAVMGEGVFWDDVARKARANDLKIWGGCCPGPDVEARRVAAKIAEELDQTAGDAPNILAVSVFGHHPTETGCDWAFDDLLAGRRTYATRHDGTQLDLQNLCRVDTIFEFSRNRLRLMRVNPLCEPRFRLPDAIRNQLLCVLESARLMIR